MKDQLIAYVGCTMTRKCTVCIHPDRKAIDRALLQGDTLRDIARQHAVSKDALHRHLSEEHITTRIAKAEEAKEIARADTLLNQVRDLQTRAMRILQQAEQAGDLRTACTAIREARGTLELLAKVTGELETGPSISITMAPEWIQVRTVILQTLEPFPEARAQLIAKLQEVTHVQ